MFCTHCGKEIASDSTFCSFCGSGVAVANEVQPAVETEVDQSEQTHATQADTPEETAATAPTAKQLAAEQPAPTHPTTDYTAPLASNNTVATIPTTLPDSPQKGKSKLPIIIVAIVVALALIGGGIAFAYTVFFSSNPVSRVIWEGTENLGYKVNSATVDLSLSASGAEESDILGLISGKATLSWQLGEDLKHSTLHATYNGGGFILKNNVFTGYFGNDGYEQLYFGYTSSAVEYVQNSINSIYNIDIDLNPIVKNGYFDKDYLELVSQQLVDAYNVQLHKDELQYGYDSDNPLDGAKVDKYQEFISKFLTEECAKPGVAGKFIEDLNITNNDGEIRYDFSLSLLGLFDAFESYLTTAAATDSDYQLLADETIDERQKYREELQSSGNTSVEFHATTKDNILRQLILVLANNKSKISLDLTVGSINSTDLNSNTKLDDMLATAKGYDPYANLKGYGLDDLDIDDYAPAIPELIG